MRLTLALSLLVTPAVADSFDGSYYWQGSDPVVGCDLDRYNDSSIQIEGSQIHFIETTCELANPTSLRDMPEGTLFDAVCSGEGEIWSERMMIYSTYDGVAVLSRGAARTYSRCE
ncbi:MAG: hypothetical protein ACSHWY_03685 [Octadecabacter sp.]